MKPKYLILYFVLLPFFGTAQDNFSDDTRKKIVLIDVQLSDGSRQSGFGFMTEENGKQLFFTTATHVVYGNAFQKKPQTIQLKFPGRQEMLSAHVSELKRDRGAVRLVVEKEGGITKLSSIPKIAPEVLNQIKFIEANGIFRVDTGQVAANERKLDFREIYRFFPPKETFVQKHGATLGFGAAALGMYLVNRNLYGKGKNIYDTYVAYTNDALHLEVTGKTRVVAYTEAEDFRKKSVPFGVLSILSTGMTAASGLGLIDLSPMQRKNTSFYVKPMANGIELSLTF